MSKRDDGGRMRPMYRTAAEERLIKAAINEVRSYKKYDFGDIDYDQYLTEYDKMEEAVRSVVRERKEKRR